MPVLPFLIAGANAGLQGLGLGINLWEQKRTWEREDTAVQRRVADLKAAGLSPTLAAGSAASTSSPIRVNAPQIDSNVAMQNAGIGQTKAQTEVTHAEAVRKENENFLPTLVREMLISDASHNGELSRSLVRGTIGNMIAEQKRKTRESEELLRNTDILRKYGVPSDASPASGEIANVEIMQKALPGLGGVSSPTAALILRMLGIFSRR